MQIFRMPVQTKVSPVVLNYVIFFYSLLGVISVFLVHIAMVLDGRQVHGHGVWMVVGQKQISVQRLGQP